ncbi:MAG: class I SAM-dependent DNA methyltransferase [Chthoniobacterales bacterium]|nr:class I SAM-dependent DNA methyltransferase [Chthoniobacterales bacterium]
MPHLSWNEVRDRAIRFSRRWKENAASERSEKQTFWNEFFDVFGIRRASVASFEENVRNLRGNTSAIDLLWRGKLLVEHKSPGEDLSMAAAQAFTYIEDLTRENRWDEIPRFVLVSDFANFVLYDLEPDEQRDLPLFAGRKIEPHHFALADFPRHLRAFAFMLGQTRVRLDPEDPANEKAYTRMCELHDSLKAGGFAGHDLERLLCRVLFCLFAEDTGIFAPDAFTQFIRNETRPDGSDLGARLNELFDWLNNPLASGSVADTDWRYSFRYVNGGLFAERLGFPSFTKAMRDALLFCCDFEWSRISPAVFGSLFQGVIDDRARRQQGAHYTSERDIMKVVRSLFLDDLSDELKTIQADRSTRRRANIDAFHEKLSGLQFLDPACGCGNFLVLAYRELRALEFDVIRSLHGDEQGILDMRRFCRVDVDQFHGIEISEWPVRIAEVAMWLMDHQMNKEASGLFGLSYERLPLTSSPHIVCGNALRMDWNDVLPKEQCSFVLGNPPFVGKHYQNSEQRADMVRVFGDFSNTGDLDYVTCWYVKAAEYTAGTRITFAFVSTNSITQGEQVPVFWGILFQRFHLKIHFAHRTFSWQSESRGRAHVHVVIIGLAALDLPVKRLTDYDADPKNPTVLEVPNISRAPLKTRFHIRTAHR